MKKTRLPKTDSIRKLATFWDTHDLTDFEEELEEVNEPVFQRGQSGGESAISVPLQSQTIKVVERMARAKGLTPEQLVRGWVLQKLPRRSNGRTIKR